MVRRPQSCKCCASIHLTGAREEFLSSTHGEVQLPCMLHMCSLCSRHNLCAGKRVPSASNQSLVDQVLPPGNSTRPLTTHASCITGPRIPLPPNVKNLNMVKSCLIPSVNAISVRALPSKRKHTLSHSHHGRQPRGEPQRRVASPQPPLAAAGGLSPLDPSTPAPVPGGIRHLEAYGRKELPC